MELATAERILNVNRTFYDAVAASFSATRTRPWSGWYGVRDLIAHDFLDGNTSHTPLTVQDAACGNLRFEQFLAESFPQKPLACTAIDGCVELMREGATQLHDENANIELTLQAGDLLDETFRASLDGSFQVNACFGFFHHIPLASSRIGLLRWLCEKTLPHGIIAISLWCFERNEAMIERVGALQDQAARDIGIALSDPGDYWLGWQKRDHTWRYCHSAQQDEIEALVCALDNEATCIRQYFGDHPSDSANLYLIWRKN